MPYRGLDPLSFRGEENNMGRSDSPFAYGPVLDRFVQYGPGPNLEVRNMEKEPDSPRPWVSSAPPPMPSRFNPPSPPLAFGGCPPGPPYHEQGPRNEPRWFDGLPDRPVPRGIVEKVREAGEMLLRAGLLLESLPSSDEGWFYESPRYGGFSARTNGGRSEGVMALVRTVSALVNSLVSTLSDLLECTNGQDHSSDMGRPWNLPSDAHVFPTSFSGDLSDIAARLSEIDRSLSNLRL